MSSFGLLNIGSQAAQANQSALNTIGQNISNVNTDGYSRQRVDLVSRPDLSGVFVNDIERISDKFLTQQVWTDLSSYNQTSTYAELSGRLDDLLATETLSVSAALDDYFGALQNVVDDPVSIPNRELFVAQADALVKRFNDLDANIRSQEETINQQIDGYASQVSTLTTNIADLNDKIRIAAAGNNPANDLRDRRDELTNQLSSLVGVTVVEQGSDEYSIFIGNGQPLVVGSTAHELVSVQGNPDTSQNELALIIAGNVINVNGELSGGQIGGMLQYREQAMSEARDELGLIAIGLAESMNAQHRSGLDMNSEFGGDLFKDMNSDFMQSNRITANADNQSTLASARVEIQDVSLLQATDYELVYGDRNQMTLIRNSDGKQVSIYQMTDATADRTVSANALAWGGNVAPVAGAGAVSENITVTLNGVPGVATAVDSAQAMATLLNGQTGVSGVTAETAMNITSVTEAGGDGMSFNLQVNDATGTTRTLAISLNTGSNSDTNVASAINAAIAADATANGRDYSNLTVSLADSGVKLTDTTGGNFVIDASGGANADVIAIQNYAADGSLVAGGPVNVTANAVGADTATVVGYLTEGAATADASVTSLDLSSSATALLGAGAVTLVDTSNNVASTIADTTQGVADVDQGEFYLDPDGKVLSFAVDGIKVTIDTPTSFVKGDRFLIQPVRKGAEDLSLVVQDGRQLALASPVRVTSGSDNQGTGVATAKVTNPDAATFATSGKLSPPVDIVFNNTSPDMTYTLYDMSEPTNPRVLDLGAGPLSNQTYTAGSEIDLGGYSVTVDNLPSPGDRFSFSFNQDGVSDNRNALAISDLQQSDLFEYGSYQDLYGSLVERIGTRTATARITEQANKAVLDTSVGAKASVSGVNLDEEAAKLVQYQQAYQASAQLIRVSQTIFDSLLNSI